MIISASRRTDIPALYPEWFMNRLLAEEVLIPNPYNRKKVSSVMLRPDVIDCIVFWTKNPQPILPYLDKIDMLGYRYCFQMTITGYGEKLEPEVPEIADSMAAFILLSEKLGKERVDWRYDPIIINQDYTLAYHQEKFEMMCQWLSKYTTRCIISFVDTYRTSPFPEPELEEIYAVAEALSKIAAKYKLPLFTCAEKTDLSRYNIHHASCIDKKKLQDILGYKLDLKKDKGQRKECACIESVDIGMYDTCIHGCKYCYASGQESAKTKWKMHDPESPLLIGNLRGDETITKKATISAKDNQLSLFDT